MEELRKLVQQHQEHQESQPRMNLTLEQKLKLKSRKLEVLRGVYTRHLNDGRKPILDEFEKKMKAIDDGEHQWHQRVHRQLLTANRNLAKGKLAALPTEEIQNRERNVSKEELELKEMHEKMERKRKVLIDDTNWTMKRKVNEIWAAYKDRIHEADREHKAAHNRYLAADGEILVEEEPKLIVTGVSKLEPAISDEEMTISMAAVLNDDGAEKENIALQPGTSTAAAFGGSISGNLAALGFGSSGSRKRKLSGADDKKEKRLHDDVAEKEHEQQCKDAEEEKEKDGAQNEKERVAE